MNIEWFLGSDWISGGLGLTLLVMAWKYPGGARGLFATLLLILSYLPLIESGMLIHYAVLSLMTLLSALGILLKGEIVKWASLLAMISIGLIGLAYYPIGWIFFTGLVLGLLPIAFKKFTHHFFEGLLIRYRNNQN
jgi:hypothetical protein